VNRKVHAGFGPADGGSTLRKLAASTPSDWYVITGSSRALLGEDIEPGIASFLEERGLELSPEKTKLTDIEEGFDFLGQNVRKYKGKLLIKPSKDSIKRFLAQVRTLIAAHPCALAGQLIEELNPLIRGWTNYHRHVVSKKVFHKVDYDIYRALWRWAVRRHRKRGAHWIRRKYFDGQWTFHGRVRQEDGSWRKVSLVRPARVPIVRHVKVRAAANPYDPKWEPYFEQRLQRKMAANLQGRTSLLRLWRLQNGVCPVCGEKISEDTGWENHHIEWRVYGGCDTMNNLVLLHPTCHHQIHNLGLTCSTTASYQGALVAARAVCVERRKHGS
jgi:RNA-directed DNA polymerase